MPAFRWPYACGLTAVAVAGAQPALASDPFDLRPPTSIKGAAAGDQAGTAIAGAGDVNGDGRGDVVIGAPGAGNHGRAYVVFGRSGNAPIDLGALSDGFRIDGAKKGAAFAGFRGAVSNAGDVNGDDLADVLVSDYGTGYVVYGKREAAPVDLANLGAAGYRLPGVVLEVAGAGDVNGDARPDFVVQTSETGPYGPPGTARVIFGRRPSDPVIGGASTGFKLVSHDRGDFLGTSLAGAGDVNADGLADVIVGAPNGGSGRHYGRDISGRVYVVYGKRDARPVNLARLGMAGFTIMRRPGRTGIGIQVGESVTGVGDMNGDGYADVAETGEQTDAAVVFGGPRTGRIDIGRLGSNGFVIRRASLESAVGVTGLGDATGDGIPDLGLATKYLEGEGGAAYVICGKASSSALRVPRDSACVDARHIGGQGEGRQVAATGDFDADGLADMLVSDNELDLWAPRARGVSYLVHGALAARPPTPPAPIYTVAGSGRFFPFGDGGSAAEAGMNAPRSVAVMPDGGFVFVDGPRIRRVAPDGRISTMAGTYAFGYSGDGGAAAKAQLDPLSLAVQPDGGILVAECDNNRVRRIAPDGTITTVAGVGPRETSSERRGSFAGDGGQATAAHLNCPVDVAPQPDGGFVIADGENYRVRRVGPDGVIGTVAGRGRLRPNTVPGATGDGGPATKATLEPDALAILADGSMIIADSFNNRVRRVWPDGTITTDAGTGYDGPLPADGEAATVAAITPYELAPTPDGGYLIADGANSRCNGEQPRVLRVSHGRVYTLAGSGRFITDPPRGDENRGDGGPATQAEIRDINDVAVAPDGGILFAEGRPRCEAKLSVGLVRYLPPDAPSYLAAALVRSQSRFFSTARPPSLSVALSLPAHVTLHVQDSNDVVEADVGAGTSELVLPAAVSAQPHVVVLNAVDTAGRIAADHLEIYPNGWLTMARARVNLIGIIFNVRGFADGYSGDPVRRCQRLAAARVDCRISASGGRCTVVVAITLRAGTIRWGSYACSGPTPKHPRWLQRPRVIRARDIGCDSSDSYCRRHPLARPFGWGTDGELEAVGP